MGDVVDGLDWLEYLLAAARGSHTPCCAAREQFLRELEAFCRQARSCSSELEELHRKIREFATYTRQCEGRLTESYGIVQMP